MVRKPCALSSKRGWLVQSNRMNANLSKELILCMQTSCPDIAGMLLVFLALLKSSTHDLSFHDYLSIPDELN